MGRLREPVNCLFARGGRSMRGDDDWQGASCQSSSRAQLRFSPCSCSERRRARRTSRSLVQGLRGSSSRATRSRSSRLQTSTRTTSQPMTSGSTPSQVPTRGNRLRARRPGHARSTGRRDHQPGDQRPARIGVAHYGTINGKRVQIEPAFTIEQVLARYDAMVAEFAPTTCLVFVTVNTHNPSWGPGYASTINDHLRVIAPHLVDWDAAWSASYFDAVNNPHPNTSGRQALLALEDRAIADCASTSTTTASTTTTSTTTTTPTAQEG